MLDEAFEKRAKDIYNLALIHDRMKKHDVPSQDTGCIRACRGCGMPVNYGKMVTHLTAPNFGHVFKSMWDGRGEEGDTNFYAHMYVYAKHFVPEHAAPQFMRAAVGMGLHEKTQFMRVILELPVWWKYYFLFEAKHNARPVIAHVVSNMNSMIRKRMIHEAAEAGDLRPVMMFAQFVDGKPSLETKDAMRDDPRYWNMYEAWELSLKK